MDKVKSLFRKDNIGVLSIILFFGLIFCSISLVNHYMFRTAAWDLGINNNAIYDYSYFRWNDCMIMEGPQFTNILSDHFTLLPILVSPLRWIFGSYTMLVVQIGAILWGGFGLYSYVKRKSTKKYLPLIALAYFYSIWGIYSALSFDYHDNVMAAMFVPWLFYYVDLKKWTPAIIYFTLILISKENMALWAFFICSGLIINYRKEKTTRLILGGMALFAAFYFIIVLKVVIPSLANEGREYLHFHYDILGKNFGDVFHSIFNKPLEILSAIFTNHTGDPNGDYAKAELHLVVVLSGGIFLLFRPQYLWMLIPIYAQKVFNNDLGKWGINNHYSIEFVPILAFAAFSWISNFKYKQFQPLIAIVILCSTAWITYSKIENRDSKWYGPDTVKFYGKKHYQREFDVNNVRRSLELIPSNASVSAQTNLVPHLCFRDYIYTYPKINAAEYIVLTPLQISTFPLSPEKYYESIEEIKSSKDWEVLKEDKDILIFRRVK